jgi:hypothetical protein
MNYPTISALLLIGGACLSGCTENAIAKDLKINEIAASENVSNALYPVNTAITNIQYYNSLVQQCSGNYVKARAFTIRSEELLAAMGMSPAIAGTKDCVYKHIRVYLAYDSLGGPQLFIVPVEGANLAVNEGGKDVFLDRTGAAVTNPGSYKPEDLYVLDLIAPCPATCDLTSLLNPKAK